MKALDLPWLLHRMTYRKCRGRCGDTSFHTAHLTWLGRRKYSV